MAARPRIGVTGTARRFAPAWWCTRLALALCGARAARISLRHEQDPEDIDGLVIGGMILLGYFCFAVVEAWVAPSVRWLAMAQIALITTYFVALLAIRRRGSGVDDESSE